MINIDLHIHSKASEYKEDANIVESSTLENAEILMSKLDENKVGLFSVTDHNRFWPELYQRLDELISSGAYPNVQGLVAGVEFDVKLDQDMEKCHIITIFDARNDTENYAKIKNAIETQKLEDKEAAYSREEYENILRAIGLNTILIACQRHSLERHTGKQSSLSSSTMESKELIQIGYISALEIQNSKVEGILINDLREIPKQVMFVKGSDCHDWGCYPLHDRTKENTGFKHTKAKILPTFKGLVMAVTSPETRLNQTESRNVDYIRNIQIQGKEYSLANGIIAIIGENGSGKSTILNALGENVKDPHVKTLVEENKIICSESDSEKRLLIKQGEIVEHFNNSNLFPQEEFAKIDTSEFQSIYRSFADSLYECIYGNIEQADAIKKIEKEILSFDDLDNEKYYFVNIEKEDSFEKISNPHQKIVDQMSSAQGLLTKLFNDAYFEVYQDKANKILELFEELFERIKDDDERVKIDIKARNYLVAAISDYNNRVEESATSNERQKRAFWDRRRKFVDLVLDAVQKTSIKPQLPQFPQIVSGVSSNPKNGFCFNAQMPYHKKSVIDDFISKMFVQKYKYEELGKIRDKNDFVKAIRNCVDINKMKATYDKNLNNFLQVMSEPQCFILDASQGDAQLGNTLGEMSLAYFKYITGNDNGKSMLLLDQPEDHISNNNISKKLIKYFNALRDKKQIIIVTHNPLLVVNQDVDQVLFLSKKGDSINVISGCLEQEDENGNILDIIADNMDGGKEAIEKRLNAYG